VNALSPCPIDALPTGKCIWKTTHELKLTDSIF
jgi:hypothetical protein